MICGCGKPLGRKNTSGRCVGCAARDPAVRAKKGKLTEQQRIERAESARRLNADPAVIARREATRAKTVDAPGYKERHAEACRAAKRKKMEDPVFMEQLREAGRKVGALNFWATSTPEAREKAVRAKQAFDLAWCPPEYWDENKALKKKGFTLAERKEIILVNVKGTEQHARRSIQNITDAQRIRAAKEAAQAF